MDEKLKIGIIGARNIGRLFSVLTTSFGYDVEICSFDNFQGVSKNNSCVFDISGDFGRKTTLVKTLTKVSDMKADKDIIFLCTKSYDSVKYAKEAYNKLKDKDKGVIVSIQNTFWMDRLMKLIPSKNSVCMYMDFTCITKNNMTMVIDSKGITIGVYDKDAFDKMKLVRSVLENFCTVYETNDIMGFTLGRNIINVTIASLGAISGLELGKILLDRNGRYLFVKFIEEFINITKALNINVLPYNNQLDYYLFTSHTLKGRMYRGNILWALRVHNKHVKSSAMLELENGVKPELEYMLEEIVKYAKKCNVDDRYTRAIHEMIKEIEGGTRRIDEDAFYDEKLIKL